MREFEFRARQKHSGSWVYGSLIKNRGKLYVVPHDYFWLDGHHLTCDSDIPVFVEEETVGQYICRKDKHDEKVYEYDKVKIGNSIYVIKYCEKRARFYAEGYYNPSQDDPTDLFGEDGPEFEVVGNIYETED